MVMMLEANKHMSLPDMTGDVWVRRSTAYSIASYTQVHDNGDDGDNVEDDLDVCESIFVKTEIWRQKTVIRDCWSLFLKKRRRLTPLTLVVSSVEFGTPTYYTVCTLITSDNFSPLVAN